jgi:D-glycero-D-manno-heptose 1,7-bisphosphate phosphatase
MSNKAIFLDRDNTLIEDPGYINHPDQVKLLDGVVEALIEFSAMGYKLIVVSNQSGVARGMVSEKTLGEIHNRLKQLLAERGAPLDRIYYCPYHPDGVIAKYRKESNWRKPNPGMLLAAADEMDIDLSQSWMIGNSSRDIKAGLQAGCKTILTNHASHYKQHELGEPNPDFRAVNIKEAVNIIKKYHRSVSKKPTQNQPASKPLSKPPLQTAEKPHQPQSAKPKTAPAGQNISGNSPGDSLQRTEQLLNRILEQLKSIRRNDMFGEFSVITLIAGIIQIIVLLCLLTSVWLLMSPTKQGNTVLITLGFAMVLQVMTLTFYVMHRRK